MKSIAMKFGVVALAMVAMVGCASTGGGKAKGMSDQDMIKSVVDKAMAGLQAGDIDTMIVDYAEDFKSDQGGGKAEMKEFLAGAKEQGFLKDIKIDMSKLVIAVDGAKATAKPINLEGAFGALTVELTLEKRAAAWVVTYQAQF
jgi:hypothetical protein